jgi:hypothetical protein
MITTHWQGNVHKPQAPAREPSFAEWTPFPRWRIGLVAEGIHREHIMQAHPATQPLNPYAPPAAPLTDVSPIPLQFGIPDGVWRQGKLLVMHKRAQLPPICLKSNQPSTVWLKRKLSWHPPWIMAVVVAVVLFYVVLAIGLTGRLSMHLGPAAVVYLVLSLVMAKRCTVRMGLTPEWAARRKRRMFAAWSLGLLFFCLAMVGLTIGIAMDQPLWLLSVPVGFVGALIVLIVAKPLVTLVPPQRISREYIWLRGVHRDLLARLPEFPFRV